MKPRLLFTLLISLLFAGSAAAQTPTIVVDRTVEWVPSVDHNATYVDGSPILTGHTLQVMAMNGTTGVLAFSFALGKDPLPPNGNFLKLVPQLGTIASNVVHTATVSYDGPGGSEVSPVSLPFAVALLRAPASPGVAPRIR